MDVRLPTQIYYFTAINILSRNAYMYEIPSRGMNIILFYWAYHKFLAAAGDVKGVESDYEFDAKLFTDF